MGEVSKTMKRIIQIQNVGNVAFPDHMTDAEVRQAAGRLHTKANQKQWEPGEDDPVVRVQTSDGKHWHVHLDDLAKLKQRDSNLRVIPE